MRHVITVARDDGTFADVGMCNPLRFMRSDIGRPYAVRLASNLATKWKKRVRVESYASQDFYNDNAKPLVTIVGE